MDKHLIREIGLELEVLLLAKVIQEFMIVEVLLAVLVVHVIQFGIVVLHVVQLVVQTLIIDIKIIKKPIKMKLQHFHLLFYLVVS